VLKRLSGPNFADVTEGGLYDIISQKTELIITTGENPTSPPLSDRIFWANNFNATILKIILEISSKRYEGCQVNSPIL
jgi:hypothetical protein